LALPIVGLDIRAMSSANAAFRLILIYSKLMYNPVSTYRFQFHNTFSFSHFQSIIPYLKKLGIGTVYASPVFKAIPGSTHGYDVLHPHQINPEIGTEVQLESISQTLKEEGIGWLQDIVPNHMAFHPDNEWLMDVLEKGQQSVYAPFFDVAWSNPAFKGQIMVPFLGSSADEAVDNGQLKLAYTGNRLVLDYCGSVYPLKPQSYITVLSADEPSQAITGLLTQIEALKNEEEPQPYSERWHELQLQLSSFMKNGMIKEYVDACLARINEDRAGLKSIAAAQVYRLCHWQETDKAINYRRFFIVNALICLNIQDENVFEQYHKLINSFLEKGICQGLRVDHIDGLHHPAKYLRRLRQLAGDETYITVEKILEPGEDLPEDWPVQGNTGYDFMALVNNLFTQKDNEAAFNSLYQELIGEEAPVEEQVSLKKEYILTHHMEGELENLYHLFNEAALLDPGDVAHITPSDIKAAIGQILVHTPVYRYYGAALPLDEKEKGYQQKVFEKVRLARPELKFAVDAIEEALLKKPLYFDEEYNHRALAFYQRLMQFSGPLMAKGVEDTLMYTYNRFVVHNEVGDSPALFGITPDEFHQAMQRRQQHWPLSQSATATHDTKRGEDARARLNVITELPDEWTAAVREWQGLNAHLKKDGMPDANDEYFIYQTLCGSYPFEEERDYADRLQAYLQKAMREAKRNSEWDTPNDAYEAATQAFAGALLDKKAPFWNRFTDFGAKIADYGILNSLSQTVLKFMAPGVPDVYQGTELFDFSFVDPDNRRPVDYGRRENMLEELTNNNTPEGFKKLWQQRTNGGIKLALVHQLLHIRKQDGDFFKTATYLPLQLTGPYKDHLLAFARKSDTKAFITIIPLHIASLVKEQNTAIENIDWKDTTVVLPQGLSGNWKNVLFVPSAAKGHTTISAQSLFTYLPLALLTHE
jgi:malto-oligosyltrehalose synthase